MPKPSRSRTYFQRNDRRIIVRPVRRAEPDLHKLARALLAYAEAQAKVGEQPRERRRPAA